MTMHMVLPVRWIVVMPVEVVAILIAGFIARLFEDFWSWMVLLDFTVLIFLTSLGRRRLEYTERLLFLQLVSEKNLRAEAEFQLSQAQVEEPSPEDATSVHTSVIGRASEGKLQLGVLADIGRREQWLLDAADLTLEVNGVLGVGGFGIVAPGRYFRTPVALKLGRESSGNVSLADLGNELRVLRKLRHPNIVLFHGAALDDEHGDLVMVLERVAGEPMTKFVRTLHTELGKGGTSGGQAANLMQGSFFLLLGVCRALIYLHSRTPPIIHGDLKDSNIFVEHMATGPRAKLLDFGLSRVLSQQTKPLGGTIRWAAPEFFTVRTPGTPADVFSLSRVIYFVLVGKLPLAGLDESAIRAAVKKKKVLLLDWPPEPLPHVVLTRPLVEAMSVLRPEGRPSMSDVCTEMERGLRLGFQSGREVTRQQPGIAEQTTTEVGGTDLIWASISNLRGLVEAQQQRAQQKAPQQLQQQAQLKFREEL